MKFTKRNWFFHLLGLLVLMLVFGVMFTGCVLWPIGGGGIGLIVAAIISGTDGGAMGLGLIVGIIVGLIVRGIVSGGSSSSRNEAMMRNHLENRRNYPNKCISCTYYLSKGECRRSGNPTSEMGSCSEWG